MTLLAVREEESYSGESGRNGWSGEAAAFCPQCKAFQTVWISNGKLMPTRKFFQEGSQVFHDCGSNQPCRIFRNA